MSEAKKSSLTGFGVKLVALITMAIDHIGAAIIEHYTEYGEQAAQASGGAEGLTAYMIENNGIYLLDSILRITGRLAFPLFCFLLCEGFMKTKHLKRYILNLLIFGLISEVPFDLAINGGRPFFLQYQNVFFTLLIGLLVLCGIKAFTEREYKHRFIFLDTLCGSMFAGAVLAMFIYESFIFRMVTPDLYLKFLLGCGIAGALVYLILSAKLTPEQRIKRCMVTFVTALGMFIANTLHTDYGAGGVLTIVTIYLFARDRMITVDDATNPSGFSEKIIPGNPVKALALGVLVLTIMTPVEAFAFIDIPIIKKYNGERGKSIKYFFYGFYPAHMLIYYLITLALGVYKLPWM